MSADKKISKNVIENRAASTINTVVQIKRLTETLDKDKNFFREVADGEKLDIPVEGIGKILVKTPSPATSSTKTQTKFDEVAYDKLDQEMKNLLKSKGVVTRKRVTITSNGAIAGVVITPNT